MNLNFLCVFVCVCVKDLNNSSQRPAVMVDSGYRAPGGPGSSVPTNKSHGGDLSHKPSTPTSNKALLPSGGGSGMGLDPKILINTPADELPEGVNPGQREVGLESQIWRK